LPNKKRKGTTIEYLTITAIAIFIVTLFLMIKRPFELRLGYAAGIGAAASLLLGTVTLGQAAGSFLNIWDAALAFMGIIALSVTLDAMGFFRWAALRVVKLARGSGLRLYFYIALLTAAVSILFANDSAVLILTPIVLEIVICLGVDKKGKLALLFTAGLIADTAAMPLITSNPINILSADYFKYSFIDHLVFMGPVALVVLLSSLLLIWLFFRGQIPKTYDVKAAYSITLGKPTISPTLLKISWFTLVAIDVGYVLTSFIGVPVALVICSGALFLIGVYWFTQRRNGFVMGEKKRFSALAHNINWDIVLFMFSIFIVIQGLEAAGVTNALASALRATSQFPSALSVFAPSMVVTIGASFMNNWPMTILGMLSIHQAAVTGPALTNLIFCNIIGNNLGPHFFPLGSLAILMWLEIMRRRGVDISLKEYLKVGAILSIAQVAIASVALWAELNLLGFKLF
jgi:arsenical pump membrane protein